MSKLIDIAKECGAEIEEISGVEPPSLIKVEMTEAQLRATVEQVAGPLVDKLTKLEKWAHLWTDETNGLLVECREALAAYTEIMGEKK